MIRTEIVMARPARTTMGEVDSPKPGAAMIRALTRHKVSMKIADKTGRGIERSIMGYCDA
ncbi:hypothetical protein JCM15831A_02330 [Asaia astilbis]